MGIFNKVALATGAASMLALSVTPAMAAVPHRGTGIEQVASYGGWGHHRRHHDRIDGGDVLLGVGILAGIAILASSGKKDKAERNDDYRDYEEPSSSDYQPGDYGDDSYDSQRDSDVGDAVEACSAAAEQDSGGRVREVQSVDRQGNGWHVEGRMSNDEAFRCDTNGASVDTIEVEGL